MHTHIYSDTKTHTQTSWQKHYQKYTQTRTHCDRRCGFDSKQQIHHCHCDAQSNPTDQRHNPHVLPAQWQHAATVNAPLCAPHNTAGVQCCSSSWTKHSSASAQLRVTKVRNTQSTVTALTQVVVHEKVWTNAKALTLKGAHKQFLLMSNQRAAAMSKMGVALILNLVLVKNLQNRLIRSRLFWVTAMRLFTSLVSLSCVMP